LTDNHLVQGEAWSGSTESCCLPSGQLETLELLSCRYCQDFPPVGCAFGPSPTRPSQRRAQISLSAATPSTNSTVVTETLLSLTVPPRFLAECHKRRLNRRSYVSAVCLVVIIFFDLYCVYVCIFVIYIQFSPYCLFVSNSQAPTVQHQL